MRGWGALVIAVLGACNQVFGIEATDPLPDADLRPDIDHDMLADEEDWCIASPADGISDLDMDGLVGSEDDCPLSPPGPDGDGDGLVDECDPFRTTPGDELLCSSSFATIELNAVRWRPRSGEQAFAVGEGYLMGFASTNAPISVIATPRLVPTTGSFTLDLVWGAVPLNSTDPMERAHGLTVWVSAGPAPSSADIACNVATDGITFTVTEIVGDGVSMNAQGIGLPMIGAAFHFTRVIAQPNKAGLNVTCSTGYATPGTDEGQYVTTSGHMDLPGGMLGDQGFSVLGGALLLQHLFTYHTAEQPPLP